MADTWKDAVAWLEGLADRQPSERDARFVRLIAGQLRGAAPQPPATTEQVSLPMRCPHSDRSDCAMFGGDKQIYQSISDNYFTTTEQDARWKTWAVRLADLNEKLREPNWHIESRREFQREAAAIEQAIAAANREGE